jgi:sensor domain CHASE-containing protein
MSYSWSETRRRDSATRERTDAPIKDDVRLDRLDMLPAMIGANPGDASP